MRWLEVGMTFAVTPLALSMSSALRAPAKR